MNEKRLPNVRVFIAIEFPEKITTALSAIQQEIRSKVEKGRFKRSENFHLTLKFLGETEAQTMEKLAERLQLVAENQQEFGLQLGQTGVFGTRMPIKVIWLGFAGKLNSLKRLQQAVETECTDAGFTSERRIYSPHITLAQDVTPRPGELFLPNDLPNLSFTVREFALVLSEERDRKRHYTPLYVFRLGP